MAGIVPISHMAEIPLPDGRAAIVDDDDYPRLAGLSWHTRKSGKQEYVATKRMRGGKTTVTYLHRMLLGCDRERIAFKNGNGLDCRRANLEVSGFSSKRKTFELGSLGEAMVIADLTKNGHEVFIPLSGHSAADLISCPKGARPIRWQVKLRKLSPNKQSLTVSLHSIHPLKGGYDRKPHDLTAIDGYAIYCPDKNAICYVPARDLSGKSSFSLCFGEYAAKPHARNAADYADPDISVTPPDTPEAQADEIE